MPRLKSKRSESDDSKLNELESFIEELKVRDTTSMEALKGYTIPAINDLYIAKMNTYRQILNKIKELKNE